MGIKFEVISKYKDQNINLPKRETLNSAGYDFEVAEDTLIPSYSSLMEEWKDLSPVIEPYILKEVKKITKNLQIKPTLVPTGIKVQLNPENYLQLAVRSSTPLNYWLFCANSIGIIDADYYNNPNNEGHIYFQIVNLSPVPIMLKKGDIIGQGIIKTYLTTEDDIASGKRIGGLGSTTK